MLPESPGYDAARTPEMRLFGDVRPLAVVRAAAAADVAETLALARRSGLALAVRSGGHCFAGRSSTEGILVDVSPLASVTLDDGTATVGAGTRLGDLYDTLAAHGRTVAAGCGRTVGIAGLALGGGLGLLGRSAGLTCDQLTGAQAVLANGRVVECDEHHDADLFWALRGAGGGSVAAVTSLRLRTLAEPSATSFRLTWPARHAAAVAEAWQAWAPNGPDALAASLLLNAGADASQPVTVAVTGTMVADRAETDAQLGELIARAGAEPVSASSRHAAYRAAKGDLAEDDDGGAETVGWCKSEFFARELPPEAIAALVAHLAEHRVEGESRELDFTPWGGAYNRVPAGATAFPHRAARFLLKHAVELPAESPAARRKEARDWLRGSWSSVHPWGSGGAYVNFPDADLGDGGAAYLGSNRDRFARVKARYDPGDTFTPAAAR